MLVPKSRPVQQAVPTQATHAGTPVQAPQVNPAVQAQGDAFSMAQAGQAPELSAATAQAGASVPAGTLRGPMAARMAQMDGPHQAARQELKDRATQAAVNVMAEQAPGALVKGDHPVLEAFGETVGLALGVVVTKALALVPSWNAPLLDANGKPVDSVPGAERQGDHDIRKRHMEVVGPRITALVEKMPPSLVREVLEGLGRGATEAPGATYRLESAVMDAFRKD